MASSSAFDRPLRFERIFLEKVWGGRALERNPGIALPEGMRVGETWEVVDREDERSVVVDGELAGRTLGELVREAPREMLGSARANALGRFPLLVKYIDAKENLSVQVHPDDAAAARIGGEAEGKSEAWYVVAVEPGAVVWVGVQPGVTREEFRARASTAGVVELLAECQVVPGDCITVPGGTVHAIGAGVTLLEVQQNSDTVFRLYDWGRVGLDGRPRAVHVERALEVIDFGSEPPRPVRAATETGTTAASSRRSRLSHTDHFAIDVLDVRGRAEVVADGRFAVYAVVAGNGRIEAARGSWPLRCGETWFLPAALDGHAVLSDGSPLRVVRLSTD